MYSTKRKFHLLLDSLTQSATTTSLPTTGNSSGLSSTSLPEEPGTRAKRRRVLGLLPSASDRSRPRSSHGRALTERTGVSKSRPVLGEKHAAPNFAPWDREQFLERLKTFRHVDRWGAKPPRVNEVQWAKRGWTCVGKERVGCSGGCGKELFVKLVTPEETPDEDEDHETGEEWVEASGLLSELLRTNHAHDPADQVLIDRYVEMIITAHGEDCFWRKRGSDDNIHHLALNHPPTSIAALRSRYESLMAMSDDLPAKVSAPAAASIPSIMRDLPADFLSGDRSASAGSNDGLAPPDIHPEAFTLALFGWEAEAGHVQGLATCEACFRRLGLWLFQDKVSTPGGDSGGEDGGALMSRLDVENEHREYCPWINGISQQGGVKAKRPAHAAHPAGWEILARVIRAEYHPRVERHQADASRGARAGGNDDAVSEAASTIGTVDTADERVLRDAKDSERWAKVKKLKHAFRLRGKQSKGAVLAKS